MQLMNVKTKKVGRVLEKTERGFILMFDGVEKEYASSTINRWWKPVCDNVQNPAAVRKPGKPAKNKVTQLPLTEIKKLETKALETSTKTQRTLSHASVSHELPKHTTELAKLLIDAGESRGATVKITSSYVGLRFNGRTAVEIHSSKRGKTKVVINENCLLEEVAEPLFERGFAKLAPDSYGWTLNMTVQLDELDQDTCVTLVSESIAYLGASLI